MTPELTLEPDALHLAFADGGEARYPLIWLRDNCPSGFHPSTEERMADLLAMPEAPEARAAAIDGAAAEILWADGHASRFPLAWLTAHRPGRAAADPADLPPKRWEGGFAPPRHRAEAILTSDAALGVWLADLSQYGLAIVEGIAGGAEAGMAVAERIGFLRQTNFGTTFEVVNKPDPNNLAYTAQALPLHTDLPNQEMPPGFQFLHCIANGATGGGSVFADGFALAAAMAARDPAGYRLLVETPIPFRFHDAGCDIRTMSPVIVTDGGAVRDVVTEIRYNAHIAGVFDMAPERVTPYYRAYRAFMAVTRDPAFQVTLRLAAGEMVAFDNRRILHGREAFDPASGHRYLHGCYVDRGEVRSRIRVLARGGA